jgi:hypothetical protein
MAGLAKSGQTRHTRPHFMILNDSGWMLKHYKDKGLARQTGLGEKSLHRMLNRNGNPTARNLGVIVRSIADDLGIKPRVEAAVGD